MFLCVRYIFILQLNNIHLSATIMKIFAFANFVLLVTLALSMFAGKFLKSDNINTQHKSISDQLIALDMKHKLFLFEGSTNACVDDAGNACSCLKDGECIIAYKECKSLKEKYPKTTEWCQNTQDCMEQVPDLKIHVSWKYISLNGFLKLQDCFCVYLDIQYFTFVSDFSLAQSFFISYVLSNLWQIKISHLE